MDQKKYIGIDVGGTKISGAIITATGEILCRDKTKTPQNPKPIDILKTISTVIQNLLKDTDLVKSKLAGIGIAVPGLVNDKTGKIMIAPNLNLKNFDLLGELRKSYRLPLCIGNDVSLGALGELWLGAAQHDRNIINLFWGTGIGGGIIIDKKIYSGSHGAAAEIGHILIEHGGPLCSCGNQGCLEAIAGRWAIERDIKQALKEGKKSVVEKYMEEKGGRIKSKALKKSIQKGDPLVTSVMTVAADAVADACISLRHIFDPEMIVFGGGVIEACGDFLLPIIREIYHKDPLFKNMPPCPIEASHLGDDAVYLGAVGLLLQKKGLFPQD